MFKRVFINCSTIKYELIHEYHQYLMHNYFEVQPKDSYQIPNPTNRDRAGPDFRILCFF